ncbi:MAG: azurin [Pseudomonadota bacterium]
MTRLAITLALLLGTSTVFANCTFELEVGDSLEFSVKTIDVGADCAEVTIDLTHTGSLPASAMGHNWVLSLDADLQDVATAGISAGLDGDYVPAGDARVIAATKIIGGGESTSITFSVEGLSAAETYTYFCSFPGHWAVMKGSFRVAG